MLLGVSGGPVVFLQYLVCDTGPGGFICDCRQGIPLLQTSGVCQGMPIYSTVPTREYLRVLVPLPLLVPSTSTYLADLRTVLWYCIGSRKGTRTRTILVFRLLRYIFVSASVHTRTVCELIITIPYSYEYGPL